MIRQYGDEFDSTWLMGSKWGASRVQQWSVDVVDQSESETASDMLCNGVGHAYCPVRTERDQ